MTMPTLHIPPNQKFAVAVAAAFVVVGIAAWGFGQAVAIVRQGHSAQSEIRQKSDMLAEERRSARASEVLLREREKDISRISTFFVSRRSPIAFIEAVEYAAGKTGNTIVLDIDESAGGESALRFRLMAEGKESGLLVFLRALELLPYKIDIQDMLF
ncbi:MAG: hypothetical protein U1A28_01020, partial [Patescibacteria group bacterium]|nr:hypothetical protein [Patescibacteria group bacterium]